MPRSGCSALHGVNPNWKKKSLSSDCIFHCISFEQLAAKNISLTSEIPNFFQLIERWCGKVILTFSILESPYLDISFYIHKIQNFVNIAGWPDRYIRHWFCCNNYIINGIFYSSTNLIHRTFTMASLCKNSWNIRIAFCRFFTRKVQPVFRYWLNELSDVNVQAYLG